jgi:iron-sulfur cluster assembly protein
MSEIVTITEKALSKISEIKNAENNKDQKLRIAVVGGGCSGLNYKIEFSDQKEKDKVISFGDIEVIIDPKSCIYLKGIVLDYQDGLKGKGFIFNNPNAKNTCGCGESFSI